MSSWRQTAARHSITGSQDASASSTHRVGSDIDEPSSSGIPLELDFRSPIVRVSASETPPFPAPARSQPGGLRQDGPLTPDKYSLDPSVIAPQSNLSQGTLSQALLSKGEEAATPGHPQSSMLVGEEGCAHGDMTTPTKGGQSAVGAAGAATGAADDGDAEESPLKNAKKELQDLQSILEGLKGIGPAPTRISRTTSEPPAKPDRTFGSHALRASSIAGHVKETRQQPCDPGSPVVPENARQAEGAAHKISQEESKKKGESGRRGRSQWQEYRKSSGLRRRKIQSLEETGVEVPSWVRVAGRVSALSVCSNSYFGTVSEDSSLADVMAMLSLHSAVIVEKRVPATLVPSSPSSKMAYFSWEGGASNDKRMIQDRYAVSRQSLLDAAVNYTDLSVTLDSMDPQPQRLVCVAGAISVDALWAAIEESGKDGMVCVKGADGEIHGAATIADVYRCLTDKAGLGRIANLDLRRSTDHIISQIAQAANTEAFIDEACDKRQEEEAHILTIGMVQNIARTWIRSPFTELLVSIFLTIDLSLGMFELTTVQPALCGGVINQADAISGLILLFYVYEASVRLFAFRWALFNGSRRLDTLDILVVSVSVIVYILSALVQTGGALRMQQVVTAVRVLRFVHLIKIIRQVARKLKPKDENELVGEWDASTSARSGKLFALRGAEDMSKYVGTEDSGSLGAGRPLSSREGRSNASLGDSNRLEGSWTDGRHQISAISVDIE